MTNETPTPNPCPFCGGTKLKVDSKRSSVSFKECRCAVSVRCMKCHARGPTVSVKLAQGQYDERKIGEAAAIEAWNKRYRKDEAKSFFAIV